VTGLWLDAEDLLAMLGEHVGSFPRVRDGGILYAAAALLYAAAARPQAMLVGVTIYPTALEQSAALLHAMIRWRPLDLWNASLGWAAADSHLDARALDLAMPAKDRMELTEQIAGGEVDSVDKLTLRLAPYLRALDG